MEALLPSLLAGLATTAGSFAAILGRPPGRRAVGMLLGGAAGVMLAVVILDLLPAALQTGAPFEAASGFAIGVSLLWLLDRLLSGFKSEAFSYRRIGYLLAIGIALHDLPEGIAIAGAYAAGGRMGAILALSIALHNIPEGIATAVPLELGGIRRMHILLLNAFIGLFTPLGTLLGLFLIRLSPQHLSFLLALAAGAMGYLVKTELIPEAYRHDPLWCWGGLFAGYLLIWAAQTL
ncbi:MAG: ZIP family metal transporter [Thermacetogeniaceae bacterium]